MLVVKTINEYDNNDFGRLYENSWSGAIDTLNDIQRADKEAEFMDYLNEIFCEDDEVEDTQLNDFIWFDREVIYEALGLDKNGEIITDDDDEANNEEEDF